MSNESKEQLVPVGVIPQFLWREQRLQELDEACMRYMNAGQEIPEEWLHERNEHIRWLKNRKKR